MRRLLVAFAGGVALAGCEPAMETTPVATTAAVFQPAQPYVGTWTGTTASGGDVNILIPASGNPTYTFRGSPVPVRSAQMSGDTVVLQIGQSGTGRIVLTPVAPGQLRYDYTFQDQQATAVLSRS